MVSLAAVHPNWLGVPDVKSGSGERTIYIIGGDGYATVFVRQGTFQIARRKTDNPESKPSGKGWQGPSKVDWVTV